MRFETPETNDNANSDFVVVYAENGEKLRGDPVDGRLKDHHNRTLATVKINGQDVAKILIDQGLARPWQGKRQLWC